MCSSDLASRISSPRATVDSLSQRAMTAHELPLLLLASIDRWCARLLSRSSFALRRLSLSLSMYMRAATAHEPADTHRPFSRELAPSPPTARARPISPTMRGAFAAGRRKPRYDAMTHDAMTHDAMTHDAMILHLGCCEHTNTCRFPRKSVARERRFWESGKFPLAIPRNLTCFDSRFSFLTF